jgi:hypothetical protein
MPINSAGAVRFAQSKKRNAIHFFAQRNFDMLTADEKKRKPSIIDFVILRKTVV